MSASERAPRKDEAFKPKEDLSHPGPAKGTSPFFEPRTTDFNQAGGVGAQGEGVDSLGRHDEGRVRAGGIATGKDPRVTKQAKAHGEDNLEGANT
ncbi:hypothetical protein CC1G_07531 [Coprinopsis cinerea okayama7|uniref:Uncharacterized protein n=1 Tax=Coprinopsis cinerea (strain Okayama-7 / 130 / ATCC MYA-4618 / FGSC 9003) TaxID=240176 RepID=A8P177_COPC7|nr:hypothetical protein CC1G_07531 [Coprinopsis cinerea okayama7\|eukprot:XP_001838041.2 hypothetical protein CC1G_07531 [Coprinopsis cinerea okayama7\